MTSLDGATGTCILRAILTASHLSEGSRPVAQMVAGEVTALMNQHLQAYGWHFKVPDHRDRPNGYSAEQVSLWAWALRVRLECYMPTRNSGRPMAPNATMDGESVRRIAPLLARPEAHLMFNLGQVQAGLRLGPRRELSTVKVLLYHTGDATTAQGRSQRVLHADLLVATEFVPSSSEPGPMPST